MTDSMLMQKDPVTFEVVRGGLYAICEEMKSVMMRASFSPLLSLSADLSCAILDQKGDVVAQGSDIPVHLGAMPFSAKGIIEAFPLETWRPGDAVLNNDPYSGGSHLPDMTLLTPVFDDDGVVDLQRAVSIGPMWAVRRRGPLRSPTRSSRKASGCRRLRSSAKAHRTKVSGPSFRQCPYSRRSDW